MGFGLFSKKDKTFETIGDKPKEFTRDELFKIALHYLEDVANFADSARPVTRRNMLDLASQKGSFIEETIKKAWEMVDNGEALKIALSDAKGGVEKRKTEEEIIKTFEDES